MRRAASDLHRAADVLGANPRSRDCRRVARPTVRRVLRGGRTLRAREQSPPCRISTSRGADRTPFMLRSGSQAVRSFIASGLRCPRRADTAVGTGFHTDCGGLDMANPSLFAIVGLVIVAVVALTFPPLLFALPGAIVFTLAALSYKPPKPAARKPTQWILISVAIAAAVYAGYELATAPDDMGAMVSFLFAASALNFVAGPLALIAAVLEWRYRKRGGQPRFSRTRTSSP